MTTLFFRVSAPVYQTEEEDERRNSVWVSTPFVGLPPVTCEICARTWGSSAKLRIPVPPEIAKELGTFPGVRQAIPWEQFARRRVKWAELLKMAPEMLAPSTNLGPPYGTVRGKIQEDVIHPMPGYLWVQDNVKEAVVRAGLSGVEPVEVVLDKEGCPRLWELNVNGRAFRAGSTLDTLVVCHHCGITKFPNPQDLTVDVARWDGSDFFNLDMNPNMLFVTERVRALFLRERFSNCEFQPVPKLP